MRIHAIQTGEVQIKASQREPRRGPRPAKILEMHVDREWTPRLPVLCWAVEHPDGTILVDTGESSRVNEPGYVPRWHTHLRRNTRFWITADDEVGPQLRSLGIDPAVLKVVMTHMHDDHAGGIGHFRTSEVVMSEKEARMAFARTGPLDGYLNAHYPDWLKPRRIRFESNPWETFDASLPLTADSSVRAVPTPGHTSGHLSVIIEQGDHLVVIAGDATYSERALLEGIVDGVAQNGDAHRESTARLRELCERRPTVYLPTHDPGSISRLAERAFTSP